MADVYPEAWLLYQAGDPYGATELLDRSLSALRSFPPQPMTDVAEIASLIRAMALRADLAVREGTYGTAQRWGAAVATLWLGADAELQPLVERMRKESRQELRVLPSGN